MCVYDGGVGMVWGVYSMCVGMVWGGVCGGGGVGMVHRDGA